MPLIFYPYSDDVQKGSLETRLDVLNEAAERYKAAVLDPSFAATPSGEGNGDSSVKRMMPRDQSISYNWEEITRILREVRDLPEGNKADRLHKADYLTKL